VQQRLDQRWHNFDQEIRERGIFYLLAIRLLPIIPYGIANYSAGLTSVRFQHYGVGTTLGEKLLYYVPPSVLGGLLLYLGLSLLVEWLYDAWFKLSHLDYALIGTIVLVGARFGFLEGSGWA